MDFMDLMNPPYFMNYPPWFIYNGFNELFYGL